MSNGDVRAALIDLASLNEVTMESIKSVGDRDQEQSIFDTLKIIFKTTDIENSSLALEQSDKTPDEIFWWIEENVVREYQDDDLKNALEFLSLADIMRNRITKRQDWSLFRYYLDFISVGIALSKKETYRKFVKYGFPTYILKKGIMKTKKKELESKIEKLRERMHCSKKIIREEMPYLKQFLNF